MSIVKKLCVSVFMIALFSCLVLAEESAGAPMPFFGFGMIEILLLALLAFIPWLIAIVDIVKSEFKGNDKLIMFLLVLTVPVIGMIIYFVTGKKMKIQAVKKQVK